MTIQNAINNRYALSINTVTIVSSQTYVPPANLICAIFEVVGAGAAIRDGLSATTTQAGAGGGQYVKFSATRAELSPSITITLGAPGSSTSFPFNGGTTLIDNGNLATIAGGLGGASFSSANMRVIRGSLGSGDTVASTCAYNIFGAELPQRGASSMFSMAPDIGLATPTASIDGTRGCGASGRIGLGTGSVGGGAVCLIHEYLSL